KTDYRYDDFLFQAEDGIRYRNVTGVQTCALPILIAVVVMIFMIMRTMMTFTTTTIMKVIMVLIIMKIMTTTAIMVTAAMITVIRSKERRVGTEGMAQ